MTPSDFEITDLPQIFHDLTPVPQNDDGNVACIDYSPQFVLAYDYFRAVLAGNERSLRALRLAELCLEQNPANYTVWHFRRVCLQELQLWNGYIDYDRELCARLGGENPKNYQIWYHRRALLEQFLENPDMFANLCNNELDYIETVLENDGKNYHAWSHRQWILYTRNHEELWNEEILYIRHLLSMDIRNNSAWNQQWFVSHRASKEPLSLQQAHVEASFAIEQARLDPFNESPWRYLVATLKEQIKAMDNDAEKYIFLTEYEEKVWAVRDILIQLGRDADASSQLLATMVDLLEWKGDNRSLQRALDIVTDLANKYDPIRQKYWALRERRIHAMTV